MREPLPPEFVGTPFRVGDALAAGVGARRMRGSDLAAPFWGVRSGADTTELRGLVGAYMARMPRGTFFSHVTAAHLWNIPLPLSYANSLPLHVASSATLRGPTGSGVTGHHLQIDRRDITTLDGIPLTRPERTVFDLAGVLPDEDLLACLDNLLWHRRPPSSRATAESLTQAYLRFRGRRGRARLVELLSLASDRADSPPESAFRLRFLRAGFPPAVPNLRVYDAEGRFIAMPDLQFVNFEMAFDYEGDYHRTQRNQWRKDLARVPRLQDAGWHHTRISGDDLIDPREMLARTSRILMERGWQPER